MNREEVEWFKWRKWLTRREWEGGWFAVPVFVRDGECERHVDGGAGGDVQLRIEGIEKCLEGAGQKLGNVRLFVNRGNETRSEPERNCAEAEGRHGEEEMDNDACKRIRMTMLLPAVNTTPHGWLHASFCHRM